MQDSPVFLEAAARPRVGLREDTLGRDSNDQKDCGAKNQSAWRLSQTGGQQRYSQTHHCPARHSRIDTLGFRTTFAASQEGIRISHRHTHMEPTYGGIYGVRVRSIHTTLAHSAHWKPWAGLPLPRLKPVERRGQREKKRRVDDVHGPDPEKPQPLLSASPPPFR